jgi:hypothetical protein
MWQWRKLLSLSSNSRQGMLRQQGLWMLLLQQ